MSNTYIEDDEFLPGDEVKITLLRVVESYDGGRLSTTEGEEFSEWDIEDWERTNVASRPENWPPQDHDIWQIMEDLYHALDGEFYSNYGDHAELAEIMSDAGYSVSDLKLVYRYHEPKAKTTVKK